MWYDTNIRHIVSMDWDAKIKQIWHGSSYQTVFDDIRNIGVVIEPHSYRCWDYVLDSYVHMMIRECR